MTKKERAIQVTALLLRVVSGLLFFQAGALKLFGWYGGMPDGGTASLTTQIGFGGLVEVVGGLALVLGLFTRPVAFIISGEMAVAYWQFHAPNGRWPVQNHGQPSVLLCFIFLFFAAYGAGELSVDALIQRRRAKAK